MLTGDLSAEVETKAEPGNVSCRIAFHPVVTVKYFACVFLLDANALILHPNYNHIALLLCGNLHDSASGRVFDGIPNKI